LVGFFLERFWERFEKFWQNESNNGWESFCRICSRSASAINCRWIPRQLTACRRFFYNSAVNCRRGISSFKCVFQPSQMCEQQFSVMFEYLGSTLTHTDHLSSPNSYTLSEILSYTPTFIHSLLYYIQTTYFTLHININHFILFRCLSTKKSPFPVCHKT
jgi:hypothetical protein